MKIRVALVVAGLGIAASPAPADIMTLDAAVRSACAQIDGVSGDGTIWFQPGATQTCQAAAQAVMANRAAYLAVVRPASVQIVSTSTPALNASYPIDAISQQKVQAISLYIAVNSKFPAGQATQAWPDATGAMHQFQTTAQWQAFATAIGDFVAATDRGETPAQPMAIP